MLPAMFEMLKKNGADVTFRPENGAFRSKLAETVIDNVNEECAELFFAHNCDIQVSVSNRTLEEGIIRFLVISDLGEQSLECDLTVLNEVEIIDLTEQLSQITLKLSPSEILGTSKVIIRKNINGLFGIHQAAQKLGCSEIFLKSKIPCSDYTYREINGKKEIKEYYWAQNLINRLCHVKLNGAKTEDVTYIAEVCCEGDNEWAEEILVTLGLPMLKTKNHVEQRMGITTRPAVIISKEIINPRFSRKK